ncbi:hypothetical protein [Novipirellula artificiosorum]|uniref:Glycosyltransferase RgtA/B/C/D-like domain-containing protein n=1 Tax=Novipirellula artificiosorum TaxID=2528016 RepID=A0A5C6D7S6_9BACT|nr:hypothetical protein [Novipirellula artificiosorum]TWU32858.1 hypothetical protein Poly41_52350 [Novipirellula artificiosorum]
MHKDEKERKKRRDRYLVLILVGLALAAGRIASVTSREGDTAFLSANDRSRWCTVAALVEDGSYAIDRFTEIYGEKRNRRPWYSIDMVRHRGADGKLHYYSSKPPLFPTMVAGVYYAVRTGSGLTLTDQPIYAARVVLALVNLPLLGLFFVTMIASIDRLSASMWARQAMSLATIFGTMAIPFSMTLNNHLVAVACTSLVVWIYLFASDKSYSSVEDRSTKVRLEWYALAGLAAAFTAANELPALSMLVLWFALFAKVDSRSIAPFLGGALIVAAGFFGTNWLAHQSLRPAYAHRGVGAMVAELGVQPETPSVDAVQAALFAKKAIAVNSEVSVEPSDEENRWLVRSNDDQLFALLRGSSNEWTLSHWDDWYEYPGSYWQTGHRRGVDIGEPSRWVYFFNMTIGSYGIFSLTPIWLLLPMGFANGLGYVPSNERRFTLAVLIASITCIAFYLARPMIDRNYGGVSCCFRWVLWFTPLWLATIASVIDRLAMRPRGRGIFIAMLVISIFSMSMALNSPWQSPWIYKFWSFLGWIAG